MKKSMPQMQLFDKKNTSNTSATLEKLSKQFSLHQFHFICELELPKLVKSLVSCFTETNKKILYYRFLFLL